MVRLCTAQTIVPCIETMSNFESVQLSSYIDIVGVVRYVLSFSVFALEFRNYYANLEQSVL